MPSLSASLPAHVHVEQGWEAPQRLWLWNGVTHVGDIYDSVFFLRGNFDITKTINRTPRAEKYRKEE